MARKGISLDEFRNLQGYKPPEEPQSARNSQKQKKFQSQKNTYREASPSVISSRATAPYNFVSLPEKILPAQIEKIDDYREHVSAANLSGEISLDIETLTPIFIGGLGTKSFAPVDKPIIPGSSLRGMFKNIFKIVTCGAFRGADDFNDEHIYFRCIMSVGKYPWTKDLNNFYNNRMTQNVAIKGKMRPVKKAQPGFLICTNDNKYFIAPLTCQVGRIDMWQYLKNFHDDKSCVRWRGKRAYIFTGKGGKKKYVRFLELDNCDWCREHWREVPDEILSSYRHDRNRRGVDLLDEKNSGLLNCADLERLMGKTFSDVQTLIPCHFLEERGKVTAFGHGQCFRIPYQKRIGDAVPENLQSDKIDFADALFGNKNWASRVFFEDAMPEKFSELKKATAHPLMQPNPTSYQLYLEQGGDNLKHWDSVGAKLRGYKFYWHKAEPDWQENESELKLDRDKSDDKRLTKEMTPLGEGSRFSAKIRFKNLSAVELGAFMMIFDLDGAEDPAYKIGMGKPFGFGSVKITPKLFVESENAYSELFDADGWKNPCREKNPAEFLAAFKKYLSAQNMLATWKNVMDDLKKILDHSLTTAKNWDDKVKSMSGDVTQEDGVDERFKQRETLPTIFEVVK